MFTSTTALSVVNDLAGEGTDSENPGIELMLALTPAEGVTVKAFYLSDKVEGTDDTNDIINIWASYEFSGWTLAAEFNTAENIPGILDSEADGYLLMANYAWEKYGVTFRYHGWEIEDGTGTTLEEVIEALSKLPQGPKRSVNTVKTILPISP